MQAEDHLCYSDRTGWSAKDVYDLTLQATGDKEQARAAKMEFYRAQLERKLSDGYGRSDRSA